MRIMRKYKLNIDFDGVILDTIPLMYEMLKNKNIAKDDFDKVREMFSTINWKEFIREAKELNNSFACIEKLNNSGMFSIFILTHVNSIQEIVEKTKFIRERFDRIPVIAVPKELPKTIILGESVEGTILVDDYSGNLRTWRDAGGFPIKYSSEEENDEFIVINSLDKVLDLIEEERVVRQLRR